MNDTRKKCIWIDLDNTPHVMFFEPVLKELKDRGYELFVTARRAFQVCELADEKGIPYLEIGKHSGKNKVAKLIGLYVRAFQLLAAARRVHPVLAVSLGSRSQVIASNLLRIPSVVFTDWEFSKTLPTMVHTYEFVPEVIPAETLVIPMERVRKYPGIKEDVYVPSFKPNASIVAELGLRLDGVVATVRPPATEAHYHNPEAEVLFERFMDRVYRTPNVQAVILPRNTAQGEAIRQKHPEWFGNASNSGLFEDKKIMIPGKAVDGLNLIWHSDLVVSGGGTMNREAAALGVPVYSIFRGKMGAVDKHLSETGRLTMIHTPEEAETKILLKKFERKTGLANSKSLALETILKHLEAILQTC